MHIVALLLLLLAFPALAQNPRAPVVLISIDGLKPEYLLEADARGLKIPALRSLLARGAHARGVIGVVPTVTYPSHATLVTGAAPARHGVITNNTFDPLKINQDGWYWYAGDIKVPTLWDAATDAGLTTANVHWPVTVGARITWNLPQYWRTGHEDDRKIVRLFSTPGLYDEMERAVGARYADGIDESIAGDELRGRFAARLLEAKRPDLMLAYFTALDHEEHASGPFSAQSQATLERIDAIVGAMIAAADRAYGGRAVIAVVSDHGFQRTDKALNIAVALRTAGLLEYESASSDKLSKPWKVATWPGGGSLALVLRDPADGKTREALGALLRQLALDPANGVDRVLDEPALRARGGFPGATFLVNLREGFTFGSASRGPLVSDVSPGGMHGYLPDSPLMRASFLVAGPDIAAGRDLGDVDQRAIAPTLAQFLGVTLRGAEAPAVVLAPAAK
jgi:predicted AlkP superfamily pyrophosphatase or phosphodiesterase